MDHFQMQHAWTLLCTTGLLKHIQIPSDISFGIYSREASSYWTWLRLGLKILGKLKKKMILRFFAIVAKRKFDTEPYDCFVE